MARARQTKRGGRFTAPELPPRLVAELHGIRIEHYYHGDDHGPPHVHLIEGSRIVRLGQNGHPLHNEPELTREQRGIVMRNRAKIRKVIRKIGRWHWFNEL